ncbi:MAG TPA: hypothetical protein VIC87_10320 [Vicinamibacteria bacterium]
MTPQPSLRAAAALVLSALLVASAAGGADKAPDPLAAEVGRLSSFLETNRSSAEIWQDVRKSAKPALARIRSAAGEGRRGLALNRLASVSVNLGAAAYLEERTPEQRKDMAAFEDEWARMGEVLKKDLAAAGPNILDGVEPAATRAVGETVVAQVRPFYESSLEYGRSTMPDAGLFYLGSAQAARDFVRWSRTLSAPSPDAPPSLRSLAPELDALEGDLLGTYRPPVSIERHSEFIGASSALNDARKLDAAGLRYGALLRYLQASQRTRLLRSAPAVDAAALAKSLREMEGRLRSAGGDQSVGRIFLEAAAEDLAAAKTAAPGPGTPPPGAVAGAVLQDVMPRYFAALEPARPAVARPPAEVTVTLVRWPFT